MKILLTGANGLLGRCMEREFIKAGHEVIAAGHSILREGMPSLDITDKPSVDNFIKGAGFTHIINCAANRDPDSCLKNPEGAYKLNTLGVEYLAAAATIDNVFLCHISTDYVFSGENPGYKEGSLPCPINLYGRSKLGGEYAARIAPQHLILRIPALYRTDLSDQRNCARLFSNLLREGKMGEMDAECVRYYTLADDVAAATRFLMKKGTTGIVHLSAEEKTSKADFCRKLGAALGLDISTITDGATPPSGDARPMNSHIDTSYYKSLGGPQFTGISQAMQSLSEQ